MPIRNTGTQYGSASKTLHWVTALLVIGLIGVGLYMHELPTGPDKIRIYGLHKSFGITVLALTFCRLLWHTISKKPGAVETLKPWEKRLAAALHLFLYFLLIAMPLSGWMMSSAANFPVSFFGVFTLPNLVAPNKGLADIFHELHVAFGTAMMAAVGLHIAAAAKHHFIDGDIVLKRMLPAFLLALLSAPAAAAEVKWEIVPEQSGITFRAKQTGAEFSGAFTRFTADIAFDPGDLAASWVRAEVDIASVDTKAADRDASIRGPEWFDAAQFPAAVFEAAAFRKTGDRAYEASGALTIRGVSRPVTLPFTLEIVPDSGKRETAVMDGHITLDRAQFALGSGPWTGTDVIANEVAVHVHVAARRK